jgi:formamidopyrimidine-DNA glycosylase
VPELPDVERFRRIVADRAVHKPIVEVEVRNDTILRGTSPRAVRTRLVGRAFSDANRHGKWLILAADETQLVAHFGMTGALRWTSDYSRGDADRLAIRFGDGSVIVSDPRNLGTIAVLAGADDPVAVTGPLGPDARDIGANELEQLLRTSRRSLKATLLDQATIAGLGNMLSDEVLWQSRLDPARRADVDRSELAALHRAMRNVLSLAIRAGHIPRGPTWLSGQRGEDDPICPRCAGALEWRRVAARSSLWCPRCQGNRDAPGAMC